MTSQDSLLDYRGSRGLNFFEADAVLLQTLRKTRGEKDFQHLARFGALCGGRLGALIEAAHRPDRLPRLKRFDAAGNRIEAIDYCLEQKEARRLLAEAMYGSGPLDLTTRMTLAYLANQNGEGGITCPLAMTEGLIELLEERGTSEQKRRYLPLLRGSDPETALPGGQYVTERQGGSNVAANETRARQLADGTWALTGLKWFCSNPNELWVTSAKVEGTNFIGLFLMPRRLADGKLNEHYLLRTKEVCGTKGKATAEVEFRGARAEMIGRPSQGLALLVRKILWVSRIHAAVGALGYLRRAVVEAELFARHRVAYGRPIEKIPQVARTLESLRKTHAACLLAYYECLSMIERQDPAEEIVVPLLKIEISRRSTAAIREAQLLIGGHGILEDFTVLPRLAQDSLVNEIWEGTHPILAEHAAKALRRPRDFESFRKGLAGPASAKALETLTSRVDRNKAMTEDERSLDNLELCSLAFETFTEALLPREALSAGSSAK